MTALLRLPARLAVALTLLGALALAVLWPLSHLANPDLLTWRMAGGRYAVDWGDGRLVLLVPPRPVPPQFRDQARQAVAGMSLASVREAASSAEIDTLGANRVGYRLPGGEAFAQFKTDTGVWPLRELLDALDDSERFAAIHLVLRRIYGAQAIGWRAWRDNSGAASVRSVDLLLVDGYGGGLPVKVDPLQLPRIRQLWYRALAVRVVSVPYWPLVLVLLLPAARRLWQRRRRTQRLAHGLCGQCGYDLRASPFRCPECGERISSSPSPGTPDPSPSPGLPGEGRSEGGEGSLPLGATAGTPAVRLVRQERPPRGAFMLRCSTPAAVVRFACAVLAAGAAFMWLRSGSRADSWSWRMGGASYALSSQGGRLVLLGPPSDPAVSKNAADEVSLWVQRIRNTDVSLTFTPDGKGGLTAGRLNPEEFGGYSRAVGTGISAAMRTTVSARLLEALDDPSRFAAAHVLLGFAGNRGPSSIRVNTPAAPATQATTATPLPDDIDVEIEGLALTFHKLTTPQYNRPSTYKFFLAETNPAVPLASQLPPIRQHWHNLLDVEVASLPWAVPLAAVLLPLILWTWRRLVARASSLHASGAKPPGMRHNHLKPAVDLALAGTSLLLACGVTALWIRSYRASGPDEWAWRTSAGRSAVRSERGRLVWTAPPWWPPGQQSRDVAGWVDQLSNQDVRFGYLYGRPGGAGVGGSTPRVGPVFAGTAAAAALADPANAPAARGPLLAALDDPGRFAVAHVLLDIRAAVTQTRIKQTVSFDVDVGGLRVQLRARTEGINAPLVDPQLAASSGVTPYDGTVIFDPAQIPALSARWRAALDRRMLTVPHWLMVGLLLAGPGAWLAGWRRRRAHRGDAGPAGPPTPTAEDLLRWRQERESHARELEKRGQLHLAAAQWRELATEYPDDPELRESCTRLAALLSQQRQRRRRVALLAGLALAVVGGLWFAGQQTIRAIHARGDGRIEALVTTALDARRPDSARAAYEQLCNIDPGSPLNARLLPLTSWTNSIGMKFVFIPACPNGFTMGGLPPHSDSDDETPHKVILTRPILMGACEVTQAQYKAIMGGNPSLFRGDDRPVERVSWYDAQEYLRRLSEKEGRRYRLPTEAEWEHACRAGTTTAYSTGDTLTPAQANYNLDRGRPSTGHTVPVGTFPPNPWGLCDMHGNVAEWCADWAKPYPPGAAVDPPGAAEGFARIHRGGSWACWTVEVCQSGHRAWAHPNDEVPNIGLRCVVEFP